MSAPFIVLTLADTGGLGVRPILVNVTRIQSVAQAFTRKPGHTGVATRESYDETGSWVCFGTLQDGDIQVTESYGEVTDAIKDVLS